MLRAGGGGRKIIIVIIVLVDILDNDGLVRGIAESVSGQAKRGIKAMRLVGITNDGIVSHRVERTRLIVQLELEMIVRGDVQIDASNHPAVEIVAGESRPPIIRDVHAKAPERCRPLAVDGERCGLNARHRNHDDRM